MYLSAYVWVMQTMLKRLGIISWWLGTTIMFIVAAGWIFYQVELSNCGNTLRLSKEIDDARAVAEAKYFMEHGINSPDEFDAALATLGVPGDPRGTPEFYNKVEHCKNPKYDSTVPMLGAVITLALWCLAFILGGSFWRPPKI